MLMISTTKKNQTTRMHKHLREFFLYGLVSSLALALDFAALLYLAKYIHYFLAATLAFLLGSLLHYCLSVCFVFKTRRLINRTRAEQLLYIAAGIAGLIVNWIIITISIEFFSYELGYAKLIASGASFIVGYLIRKFWLFTQPLVATKVVN